MSSEINAITLACTVMAESVQFYTALGFELTYGGPEAPFTSLAIGANYVNLQLVQHKPGTRWGRVVFHVPDPDAVHRTAIADGYPALTEPADAPWGERYFHLLDPDGHELSFARRL